MRSASANMLAIAFFLLSPGAAAPPVAARQNQAEVAEQGRELFTVHCASCHGSEGRGDGPVGRFLKQKPADLTRIQLPGREFPRGRIAEVIDGEKIVPVHGSRSMPVWGRVFRSEAGYSQAQQDIHVLVLYLETLQIYRSSEQ